MIGNHSSKQQNGYNRGWGLTSQVTSWIERANCHGKRLWNLKVTPVTYIPWQGHANKLIQIASLTKDQAFTYLSLWNIVNSNYISPWVSQRREICHSKFSNFLGLGLRAWCSPLHAKLLSATFFPSPLMSMNAIFASMPLCAVLLFELYLIRLSKKQKDFFDIRSIFYFSIGSLWFQHPHFKFISVSALLSCVCESVLPQLLLLSFSLSTRMLLFSSSLFWTSLLPPKGSASSNLHSLCQQVSL